MSVKFAPEEPRTLFVDVERERERERGTAGKRI